MNVVVLVLDTLRYDCVHHRPAPGIATVSTPYLDALRRDGVSFSAIYGEAEPTIPVRRALWTGLRSFPWRFDYDTKGLWPNVPGWHKIPPEHTTLSELLLENGYKTCLIGDVYHLFKPTQNFTRGFLNWDFVRGQEADAWQSGGVAHIQEEAQRSLRDTFDPARHSIHVQYLQNKRYFKQESELTGGAVVQRGMRWLEDNHDDGPFFLWLESFDPHEPWDPPREYANRYYDFPKGKDGVEYIFPGAALLGTEEEKERTKALYYGEITFMDAMIGRLANKLADLGRLEDTAIMITSDHGTELLDHGRFGKSPEALFSHNTQLNWIVRHPQGYGRGQTIDAFTQNHDIAPTILDMLGLLGKWPGATDVDRPEWAGRSTLPLIEGNTSKAPEPREFVITGWSDFASVRDRDWNYTVNFENPEGTERLYDLRRDTLELRDVSADHANVVRDRRRLLEAHLGQELPAKLEDPNAQSTIGPCRVYFGSRPTRAQERAGFV